MASSAGTLAADFTAEQTFGDVEFGNNSTGYALRVNSQVIPITWGTARASATLPGNGWVGLGARQNASGYELLWKNTPGGWFAAWNLDATGAFTSGRSVTLDEIHTLETQVAADIDGDSTVGSPSAQFTTQQTIGGVEFGSNATGYALRVNSQVIPITWGTARASANVPGGGWVGLGARQNGSGYEMLWKNTPGGWFAAWNLDTAGAFTGGRSVTLDEIHTLETQVAADIDGDSTVGSPSAQFTTQQTIGGVEFGSNATGYALRVNSQVIPITWGTARASANVPGGGWVGLGARQNGSGYEMLWKNTPGGWFAAWNLDAAGAFTGGRSVTLDEIHALETQVAADIDGDSTVGSPSAQFTTQQTFGGVEFGSNATGYALRVNSQVIPITWGTARASTTVPGSGWVGLGARQNGSGYELLWKNTQSGAFAAWALNASGAFVSGRSVTLDEIRALETQVAVDIDGDGTIGSPSAQFTTQQTFGAVEFGSNATGYALRVNSQVIPITWGTARASANVPGGGWVGLGARQNGSGYEMLWVSTQSGGFAAWNLDSSGAFVSGRSVTVGEIRVLESQVGVDIDGDGRVG